MLKQRANLIREIREFFYREGFIEVDTPSLVYSPGMEPHICPIQVPRGQAFLPTSPEFAMKRILAEKDCGGKIFQICKAFRDEPLSSSHHPEFTILEWYRTNSGYEQIMDDVENLFVALVQSLAPSLIIENSYGQIDYKKPWLRLSIEECFEKFVGVQWNEIDTSEKIQDLCVQKKLLRMDARLRAHDGKAKATNDGAIKSVTPAQAGVYSPDFWDDCFFLLMMNIVEPAIQKLNRPVILYNYPASQAALSNLFTDLKGVQWAKRFEVYAGGLELGNAFDELTNPQEQRSRFLESQKTRKALYGDRNPESPMDEAFLKSLEKLPPSGGIAMGVDRMIMLLTGAQRIQDVLWQDSWWKR